MSLPPAVAGRLSKLLPLLSSDKDGEVVATARAIQRTLAAADLDFHSLAATLSTLAPELVQALSARALEVPESWSELSLNDKRFWLSALCKADWLTSREREIIEDLENRFRVAPHEAYATPKKVKLFNRLVAMAAGMGVRP
jgi:hypothetical protein